MSSSEESSPEGSSSEGSSSETGVSALRRQVESDVDALRRQFERFPAVAVIAESGLPALLGALTDVVQHPFGEAESVHVGTLAEGAAVALVQARSLGDGFSAQEAALPVRVLAALGVEAFVLLGEAAALAARLRPGGTLLLSDHLNLQGANPLAGANEDDWGPRFPDMSAPYDAGWRAAVQRHASGTLSEGIYAAVNASTTPAERTMLRRMGADAVGTGFVPEVLAARHMDRRVLAAARLTSADAQDVAEGSAGEADAGGEAFSPADLLRVAVACHVERAT